MDIGSSTAYSIGSNYFKPSSQEQGSLARVDGSEKSVDKQTDESKENSSGTGAKAFSELSQSEKQLVTELQTRDKEVRAHEAAHQSAGAPTGGASFSYQKGPDGKNYAIGGEVSISIKTGSTPQETISNMKEVIAAAMAPADPSAQDVAVASSAMVMQMKAQQQLRAESQKEAMGIEAYKNEANSNDNKSTSEEQEQNSIDIPA